MINLDNTEGIRREMVKAINSEPSDREKLEKKYGKVWDTSEVGKDFEVIGFMAPFITVKRKEDSVRGVLMFQHSPRYYFDFQQT